MSNDNKKQKWWEVTVADLIYAAIVLYIGRFINKGIFALLGVDSPVSLPLSIIIVLLLLWSVRLLCAKLGIIDKKVNPYLGYSILVAVLAFFVFIGY
ncbi:hypothetical protein MUG87_08960 [Ectobacillus sp. JY-23]|uniref:hypothetical protein n=1 Tax=Ectobacillus sp. JY-23 TaxID=2933872 RepID=UPI001FF18A08|nr:hypothetical protein [Ectobacillus sp. JY-23]UOY94202.1 hypothetical protein MUG87_08960 [Ectobacillus sp. JY-23]